MRNKTLLLISLLLLAPALSSCKRLAGGKQPETQTTTATAEFAFKIKNVPVESGRLVDQRTIAARVEPTHDSRIAASAGGKVVSVLVDVGDSVEKGQTLIQLDDSNYRNQLENARLALQKARLNLSSTEKRIQEQEGQLISQRQAAKDNLELTQKKLDEVKALYAIGAAAANDVQQLEVALEQAKANYAAAEAAYKKWLRSRDEDLKQLRLQVDQASVAVKQAEKALADTRITAPFAGEVADRFVDVGAFVGPGAPTVRLVSGPQEVSFKLPPDDVSRLLNDDLKLLYLGREYPLQILRTSPVPGQDLLTRVTAKPLDESGLPLGAAGTVAYSLLVGEGTLVPAGALRSENGQTYVFAAENGKARAYAVELVGESKGTAVINGLPEEVNEVIYPLPQDLTDGSPVEVVR